MSDNDKRQGGNMTLSSGKAVGNVREKSRMSPFLLSGSGQVRDLREAVSLSPDLTNTLTQYAQAPTRTDQRALLDQMIKAWSEPANGASLHRGPRLDPIADTSPMATTL